MKALYNLTYEEFEKLVEDELRIDGWFVYNDTAASRLDKVKDKQYFTTLKKRAEVNDIPAHDEEIISWLDTLNLLYIALKNVDEQILNQIQIIQEYTIPFTRKRADYLLVCNNKILIVEFSFDKWSDAYRFETKLNQAVNYKELLANLLPSHIKIGTYTFLINPEADEDGYGIYKYNKFNKYSQNNELANNEKLYEFGMFINLFFSERSDAMMHLGYIDYLTDSESNDDDE